LAATGGGFSTAAAFGADVPAAGTFELKPVAAAPVNSRIASGESLSSSVSEISKSGCRERTKRSYLHSRFGSVSIVADQKS
jgi:hypothetical protein